jgi:hypothetical protein
MNQIYILEGIWDDNGIGPANPAGAGIIYSTSAQINVFLSKDKESCMSFDNGSYIYNNPHNFMDVNLEVGSYIQVGLIYDMNENVYYGYIIDVISTPEITYSLQIGDETFSFVKNQMVSLLPNQNAEYYITGLSVNAGDLLTIYYDGQIINMIGPESGLNNIDYNFKVITSNEKVDIYLKVWNDGGYSVWVSGRDEQAKSDVPTSGIYLVVNDYTYYEMTLYDNMYIISSVNLNLEDKICFYDADSRLILNYDNLSPTTQGIWSWNYITLTCHQLGIFRITLDVTTDYKTVDIVAI